ncbi:hypothetical protein [Pseudomonas sp. A-B-19]|uniref:hypothetical protein n=1 Tax=Pseudomonas sp. A-B-19 TaxID=2832405 RepID=UPI001CBC93E7|nr:hypothetical protein [Pseudomonas sp. A-B-19]
MRSTNNFGCGVIVAGALSYVRSQAINPLLPSVNFCPKTIVAGAKGSSDLWTESIGDPQAFIVVCLEKVYGRSKNAAPKSKKNTVYRPFLYKTA